MTDKCEEKRDSYSENRKWKLLAKLYGKQKYMRKIITKVNEQAKSGHTELHTDWLARIAEVINEEGEEGRIYVSRLLEVLKESPQSLSRSLRILEQEKLLERHSDTNDRRKTYVQITEFGKEILVEHTTELVTFISEVLEIYGYERMEAFEAGIEQLIQAMEETNYYKKIKEERK